MELNGKYRVELNESAKVEGELDLSIYPIDENGKLSAITDWAGRLTKPINTVITFGDNIDITNVAYTGLRGSIKELFEELSDCAELDNALVLNEKELTISARHVMHSALLWENSRLEF